MSEITADLTLNTKILLRRAEFDDACILAQGEPGYHTTTHVFKIGDGETAWKDLPFANEAQVSALIKALENSIIGTEADTADKDTIKGVRAAIDAFKGLYDGYTAVRQMTDEEIASAISKVSTEVTNTISPAVTANTEAIAAIKDEATGIAAVAKADATTKANQALADAKTYAEAEADQALVDAKAYSDEQDVFHTDILTVNSLGGVAANADLDGLTVREILNTLLYPYVAFVINSTARSAAATTLENGATQTLSSCSISVTKKSKPITSIKLFNGSTLLQEKTDVDVKNSGTTIVFDGFDAITVSKSNNPNLKFTVTDGQTSADKTVGASTFVYPYYWGECAADADIDEALVKGLTKKVESKGNKTVIHTMNNGRMVIAYPKAHGVLKSILDPNNFETIGDYTRSEVSITGLDGTAQTYYVYASGAATVSSFKVQYKY